MEEAEVTWMRLGVALFTAAARGEALGLGLPVDPEEGSEAGAALLPATAAAFPATTLRPNKRALRKEGASLITHHSAYAISGSMSSA